MSAPKSVVRFKKDGIEYISNVDFACYTIVELSRAAMRDVGKFNKLLSAKSRLNSHNKNHIYNVQIW